MAYFSSTTAFPAGRPASVGVLRLIRAVQAWNAARATRSTLSRLSDHELDDIGLVRGDIDNLG